MAIKIKRRGAPKKDAPAGSRFEVRCTSEQRQKWQKAADKAELSLSSWLKSLADKNS